MARPGGVLHSQSMNKPFDLTNETTRYNELAASGLLDKARPADRGFDLPEAPPEKSARPMVLIVDDDPRGLAAVQALLINQGYELLSASNGSNALRMAEEFEPDLILLDVMMPGIDGFEVRRRLRSKPRLAKIPVVMTTALDDRESQIRGIEAGVDDFISRPLDMSILRARVQTIIRLNRYRRIVEAQENFDRLMNRSPHSMVVVDQSGRIVLVNDTARKGLDPSGKSNLTGRELASFGEGDTKHILKGHLELQATGQAPRRQFEGRLRREDGETFPAKMDLSELTMDGQRFHQVHISDISDMALVESQLIRAQRMETLGFIVAGMVHDLRSVFTGIICATSAMKDSRDLRFIEDLQSVIERSSKRGAGILARCLDMVRNNRERSSDPADPDRIITELVGLMDATFPKNIRIQLDVDQRLPAISMGQSELYQALINLCLNARDAMPHGGVIKLRARCKRGGACSLRLAGSSPKQNFVAIDIADTGNGISDEILERIFEPLFTTKSASDGTGLGLSTSMRLLRRAGGDLTVCSVMGQGSRFSAYIPTKDFHGAADISERLDSAPRG